MILSPGDTGVMDRAYQSGLGRDLYNLALLPTQIMVIMPGFMVLLSFQRSILVNARRTDPITLASIIEAGGTILVLLITIKYMSMVGVIGAALSLLIGRVCANAYLFIPYFQELKKGNVP